MSTLTFEQHERIKQNKLAALQRLAQRQNRKQIPMGSQFNLNNVMKRNRKRKHPFSIIEDNQLQIQNLSHSSSSSSPSISSSNSTVSTQSDHNQKDNSPQKKRRKINHQRIDHIYTKPSNHHRQRQSNRITNYLHHSATSSLMLNFMQFTKPKTKKRKSKRRLKSKKNKKNKICNQYPSAWTPLSKSEVFESLSRSKFRSKFKLCNLDQKIFVFMKSNHCIQKQIRNKRN